MLKKFRILSISKKASCKCPNDRYDYMSVEIDNYPQETSIVIKTSGGGEYKWENHSWEMKLSLVCIDSRQQVTKLNTASGYERKLGMMRVADQSQDANIERDQNGGQRLSNRRSVAISDVPDVGFIDRNSSPVDRACVRSDHEDVSRTCSTQCSDGDGSLAGNELGSWSNEQGLPVSHDDSFDDIGAPVLVSDVPTVGDVCVKDSPNVHFGHKTFYNGSVTVEKIVYPNPSSTEGNHDADVNRSHGIPKERNAYSENGKVDPENTQDNQKVKKWCLLMLTWRCVALMCVMGSCIVTAVVVGAVFLSTGSLRFVEREAWGAKPPSGVIDNLTLPVPYVMISHTATEFCQTQSECSFRVRWVQSFHAKSQKWSDIGYNFLVGGDGSVYVGRGWNGVGAHSYGYNVKSIGISFIGTFNDVRPPKRQLLAAQQLIDLGVEEGKVKSNYTLLGHRQVSRTLSPGDALYNIIKTWSHWAPKPPA